MSWQEMILMGMKLIKAGCEDVEDFSYCPNCPFYNFCSHNPMRKWESPDHWKDSDLTLHK